jgi:Tfp pilus assembly protein PilF/AraC-like DNA-binding protein/TolB-like protein
MPEHLNIDQIFIGRLTEITLANLMNEKFSVNDLAKESGMSRKVLGRRLHTIKKVTTAQFIREVRLHKALEILQNEYVTASEVSYKTGFGSPAYFNKCFHDFFGYPPGEVKKRGEYGSDQSILTNADTEIRLKKTSRIAYLRTIHGILILALVLGTAGLLIYNKVSIFGRDDNLISTDGRISIAVLPFRNMTNDTIWNIWQDNIQQILISSFSACNELKVRQKETMNPLLQARGLAEYSGLTTVIADKISQKAEANFFIYGTIEKAGSSIRLDAQLIKTKTIEVLQSFEITGQAKEEMIFSLIDTLKEKISAYLLISKILKKNPPWHDFYKTYPLTTNSPEALRFNIYGNKASDDKTAISWYLKALAIDSNYFDPMMGLSSRYSALGMEVQSLQWVLRYYNKKDRWPYVQQLWASWAYAFRFESNEERLKYLRQLQQIDDQNTNTYFWLGLTYCWQQQYDKAIPELEKMYQLDRKLGKEFLEINSNYILLGEAYQKTNQYKKAKKLYKTAEKYITDDPMIISNQVILSLAEKDSSAASRYIGKYISVLRKNSSSESDIAANLALIYQEAGAIAKAEDYYRRALSLDPENPVLLNNFARFLGDNKIKQEEFNTEIDKALLLAPNKYDYCNYLANKGWGLYKFGHYQKALEILQQAWDSAPFKIFNIKYRLDEVKETVDRQK